MTLADLSILLQETAEELYAAKASVTKRPTDVGAMINLQSLEKRLDALQVQFDIEAAAGSVEVLRYRMIGAAGEPPIKSVTDMVSAFQRSFSVVFDSLATKSKKTRARVGADSLRLSTLSFAYAFPGSVGFALTLPRELTLIEQNQDDAMLAIKALTSVSTVEEVRGFAARYGIASVRTLFQWFDAIAKADLDSEVEWNPGTGQRERFLVQVADARAMRNLIESTSETETSDRNYRGTLIAYDSARRTFRFAVADKTTIGGAVSESIEHGLMIPARYSVTVRVSTINRYSTEQREERFELTEIRPEGR